MVGDLLTGADITVGGEKAREGPREGRMERVHEKAAWAQAVGKDEKKGPTAAFHALFIQPAQFGVFTTEATSGQCQTRASLVDLISHFHDHGVRRFLIRLRRT